MFDIIMGLPLHPLVVHATVVLLPLMAIVTVAMAVRVSWRPHLRWAVVANGLVAVAAFATVRSGDALKDRLKAEKGPGFVEDHEEWGERAFIVAVLFFLVSLAVTWALSKGKLVVPSIGVLAVAALVVVGVVAMAGHTGATSVWKGDVAEASAP